VAESIGSAIKRVRDAAGLTQSRLAELSEVPQNTISQWENGASEPAWSALMKLARAAGVSCEEFKDAVYIKRRPGSKPRSKAGRPRKPESD
jgi:transcriptional regulator with XRE-family HTH domain